MFVIVFEWFISVDRRRLCFVYMRKVFYNIEYCMVYFLIFKKYFFYLFKNKFSKYLLSVRYGSGRRGYKIN